MTGRIKLLKNGEPIQKDVHLPELGYEYDMPSEHDDLCGTYGLNEFKLPHEECPETFVCDVPADNKELVQFSKCFDSMNCAILAGEYICAGIVKEHMLSDLGSYRAKGAS